MRFGSSLENLIFSRGLGTILVLKALAVRTVWGCSSAGRASRSQCEGQGFDPPHLHQIANPRQFRLSRIFHFRHLIQPDVAIVAVLRLRIKLRHDVFTQQSIL